MHVLELKSPSMTFTKMLFSLTIRLKQTTTADPGLVLPNSALSQGLVWAKKPVYRGLNTWFVIKPISKLSPPTQSVSEELLSALKL